MSEAAPVVNQAGGERRYQNTLVVSLTLFLAALSVTIVQYKIPTIMTPIMQQFNMDAFSASWLMSIFTFVGIVFAIPVGMISRKVGAKTVIVIACFLAAAFSVVAAFVPSGALLLGTRVFEGVAFVCVIACGPVVIQATVDPKRNGLASGIWMLAGTLGAMVAGVLTPTLFEGTGFSGLCLVDACIAVLAGVLVLLVIRMPKAMLAPVEPAAADAQAKPGNDLKVYLKPNTWLFFAAFAIFQILLLCVLTYSPTFLQQQGISAAMSGLMSTTPMLLAIISSIAFGAISDAIGRCKPLFIISLLAMTICVPIMLTNAGPLMWVGAVGMGLIALGFPAIAIAAYPQILGDPKLLAFGMGVLLLMQSFGQFLGSLIPSMLLGPDVTNWVLTAGVMAVLGLAGTVLAFACKFK